jgi:hypothetical protein
MSKLVKAPRLRGTTNGEEVKLNKKYLANAEDTKSEKSDNNKNITSVGCLQLQDTRLNVVPGCIFALLPFNYITL